MKRPSISSLSPGFHARGDGLYFQKGKRGGSWIYRYRRNGKVSDMGLGSYPVVSEADARRAMLEAKGTKARGLDPVKQRSAERRAGRTFEEVARDYWSKHVDGHVAKPTNWLAAMERHVFPHVGSRPVHQIDVDDLTRVFRPLWNREVGRKLRQWVKKVIISAAKHDARVDVRLMELVENDVGKQRIVYEHHPSVPWRDAAKLYSVLPDTLVGVSMKLLMLSSVRVDAVSRADWSEFDLDKLVWTIPKERLKGWTTGFRVPLTNPMLDVLRLARRMWGRAGYLFPSETSKNGHLSNNAHRLWLHKHGWKDEDGRLASAHGFRATFGGWCEDHEDVDLRLADFCLQHKKAKPGETQAAYFRRDQLNRRRPIMEAWAEHLLSETRRTHRPSQRSVKLDQPAEGFARTKREIEHWYRESEDYLDDQSLGMTEQEARVWTRDDGTDGT